MMKKLTLILVFAIMLISTAGLNAHGDEQHEADSSDSSAISQQEQSDNGEVESLELKDIVDVTPQNSGFSFKKIWGRLHPAFVHFPIAWLFMLFVTEIIAFIYNKPTWHKAGFYMLIILVLSFVPAVTSGLVDASLHDMDAAEHSIMVTHRTINFIITGLVVLALVFRLARRGELKGSLRGTYLGMIIIATVMIMISGHLGAKMVFGSNYLPF
jgi:uncharacterized membrane protein